MRRLLLSCLPAVLLVSSAFATIDLTPVSTEHEEHGMKYRLLTFKHGDRKIEYAPPSSWTVRGAADRVQFTPPGTRYAEAQIQAVPLAAPVPLDEARILALEQQVLRELPAGSHAPEILERMPAPIALGDHPSYAFLLSYQNLGHTFQRRVIFVHAPDVQLIFRFTAEKPEFDRLYTVMRQSLTSWRWMQPATAK